MQLRAGTNQRDDQQQPSAGRLTVDLLGPPDDQPISEVQPSAAGFHGTPHVAGPPMLRASIAVERRRRARVRVAAKVEEGCGVAKGLGPFRDRFRCPPVTCLARMGRVVLVRPGSRYSRDRQRRLRSRSALTARRVHTRSNFDSTWVSRLQVPKHDVGSIRPARRAGT